MRSTEEIQQRKKRQRVSALPMFAHFPTVYVEINRERARARNTLQRARGWRVSPVRHGFVSARHFSWTPSTEETWPTAS